MGEPALAAATGDGQVALRTEPGNNTREGHLSRLLGYAIRRVPSSEDDATRLLCFVLYRNETHARPLSRLADRLGIGGVVLSPLHERLDVGRRYQSDRMTKLRDLSSPIMRATAGLQSNQPSGLRPKEFKQLGPGVPLAEQDISRRIHAVSLENLLRDIQTDRANLRHGRLPQVVSSTPPLWHIDAAGGRPPHQSRSPCLRGGELSPARLDRGLAHTRGRSSDYSARTYSVTSTSSQVMRPGARAASHFSRSPVVSTRSSVLPGDTTISSGLICTIRTAGKPPSGSASRGYSRHQTRFSSEGRHHSRSRVLLIFGARVAQGTRRPPCSRAHENRMGRADQRARPPAGSRDRAGRQALHPANACHRRRGQRLQGRRRRPPAKHSRRRGIATGGLTPPAPRAPEPWC